MKSSILIIVSNLIFPVAAYACGCDCIEPDGQSHGPGSASDANGCYNACSDISQNLGLPLTPRGSCIGSPGGPAIPHAVSFDGNPPPFRPIPFICANAPPPGEPKGLPGNIMPNGEGVACLVLNDNQKVTTVFCGVNADGATEQYCTEDSCPYGENVKFARWLSGGNGTNQLCVYTNNNTGDYRYEILYGDIR
jgi:hypothetical protein